MCNIVKIASLDQRIPKLIVIVPGSKTKTIKVPVLGVMLDKFYEYFGVDAEGDEWIGQLSSNFARIPAETLVFNWSGGISPFAVRRAGKELERILSEYQDRDIFLFAKSLGGSVARTAAQNTRLPIKLLVYVATPHFRFAKRVPPSVRVINIFSLADNYQQLANWLLYFAMGRVSLPYARNIEIPSLRHSDFNHNIEIQQGNKKQLLFDFYQELVRVTE